MTDPAGYTLLRSIAQFNLLPSIELHPDHQPSFAPASIWAALAGSRLGHRHLSARILEVEKLGGDWVTAFETRERRLALLGWRALEHLMMLTGIALNASWIATRIDRNEVAALKSQLGPRNYAFALGRARFLGLPPDWPAPDADQDRMSWFQWAGLSYVESCAQRQPRSYRQRLALRLPRPVARGRLADELPRPDPGQATALFRKLSPEVGPQCVSLLG